MNPNAIISAMFANNPQLKNNPVIQNAFQMAQAGNADGIRQIAENVAREKGVNIQSVVDQINKTNVHN